MYINKTINVFIALSAFSTCFAQPQSEEQSCPETKVQEQKGHAFGPDLRILSSRDAMSSKVPAGFTRIRLGKGPLADFADVRLLPAGKHYVRNIVARNAEGQPMTARKRREIERIRRTVSKLVHWREEASKSGQIRPELAGLKSQEQIWTDFNAKVRSRRETVK